MSPPSLSQLAFNKICLHLWKESPLLTIQAEFSHKYKNDFPDSESEGAIENEKKISVSLEEIENRLARTEIIPYCWRQMALNAIHSMCNGIRNFMAEMVRGLTHKKLNNIKFCAQHAVYTENLSIDMTESICNILHKSKFEVVFTKSFLGSYCVEKSKLKTVVARVCNELENEINKRSPRKVAYNKKRLYFMRRYIMKMITGKQFYDKNRRNDAMEYQNSHIIDATDIQYAGVVGPFDALKYYYKRACKKLEGSNLDYYIFDCVKYLFLVDADNATNLAFFQDKLKPEMWTEFLCDNFDYIFLKYLASWHYRDRCMPLLYQVKKSIDVKTLETILRDILIKIQNKYNSHGIMTVTKQLWDEIPSEWKTDSEIIRLVPYLIVLTKKFDQLPYFLKDYCVAVQEDICASIIYGLVSRSEETHVEAVVEAAQELGLKQKDGKQFSSNDNLKSFLLHKAASFSAEEFDKVTKYVCHSDKEEYELKRRLLLDKYFIVDFLVKIDSLLPFFQWAFKDDTELNAFKAKLIEDEVIDCVYERRLIESSFYGAKDIFSKKMLDVNEKQQTALRLRMKDNTSVIHWHLSGSLEGCWFPLTSLFEDLYFSKEESEELMREFLYLPETIQAVYDMVLDLPNFEKSIRCFLLGSELMLLWISFITDIVTPYTNVNEYKNMLFADIDTVVRECCKKVRGHPKFGRLQDVEFYVRLRFKCFSLCFERRNLNWTLEQNVRFAKTDRLPFMFRIILSHSV